MFRAEVVAVIPAGVRAVALFDPAREGPPPDAIDVQLRLPRSMQVWVDDLARSGQSRELVAVQELVEGLVPELVVQAQKSLGRIEASDPAVRDARIAVTPLVEGQVPGEAMLRPHVHLYLGGTGWRLDTGAPAPVSLGDVCEYVDGVSGLLLRRLMAWTEERHGFRWGYSDPSGMEEIVDPPDLAQRGEAAGYATCPGPWGPRRLVLGDAWAIEMAATRWRRRAAEQAAGVAWEPDADVEHLPGGGTKLTPEAAAKARRALGLNF